MKKIIIYAALSGAYFVGCYYGGKKLGERLGYAICDYLEEKSI